MDKKYTVGDSSFPAKEILKDLEPMTKEKTLVQDVTTSVGKSVSSFAKEMIKEVLTGR